MRSRNPYGLYKPASRPQTAPYKGENRRLMREEWADFCIEHCPHPGKKCRETPCKEFRERFGRRRDG